MAWESVCINMGYSRGTRSESPKELPSRINRQRRSSERREGPLGVKCDDDHNHKATSTATTSTRCASTQTLITSEMVGIPEINPDLPTPSSSSLISQDHATPVSRTPAMPSAHPHRHRNMPQQLLRPSVITCAPAPLMRESNGAELAARPGAGGGVGHGPVLLNGRGTEEMDRWSSGRMQQRSLSSSDVDPDIEEHFRRSLGRHYKEAYSSPPPSATSPTLGQSTSSSSSSPPSSLPNGNEVNITGSVDDHFAKALGDKWSQIKDVIEPSMDRSSPSSSPSSSPPINVSSPVVQQQASVAS
ncbi:uncharacterized protein [Diadema setosum]|uniref:uncharacterized protein isoform X2 n=1 Tax=Diadema setosum TaxID=31175 RepID=UPI003B3B20C5